MMNKFCPSCESNIPKTLFYKNKARTDGINVYCIKCQKYKQKQKQDKKIQNRLKEHFIQGEIWKDISTFNNYEVSTEGRIRNKKTKCLLKPSKGCSGYAVSSIKKKNIKFHRIVAGTFLPNYKNKPTVEHKDDNKMNNKIYNLKWATYKEQQQFVINKKTRSSQTGSKIGTSCLDNLDNELWKTITKFPDYEISSNGRIKYPIRKGKKPYLKRITYGGKSGDGYNTFSLRNNKILYNTVIHRLVAKEFLSNPNNYKIVNHKDGNKQNNKLSNLEWCSRSYNTKHAYDNNLISGKRCILQLDENNNIIKEWETIKLAYTTLKLSRTGINSVLSGNNRTSGGFFWCYKEYYNINKIKNTK